MLERLRQAPLQRDLGRYRRRTRQIDAFEESLTGLSLPEVAGRMGSASLVEGFALVREVARRQLGLRPFEEQMIAGLALHEGKLVEMQTGEGKTLAAVAPACMRAREGRGVHVLTFNDYLARRDAAWMRPVYESFGLSVGVIQEGMQPAERRAAYAADVTYATAKEAGFDYLRESLAMRIGDRVLRPPHFAIVDEADSILIDEARVPLVIAGSRDERVFVDRRLCSIVAQLERERHYVTDDHERNVNLTDEGLALLEERLDCGDLLQAENLELLTQINCALHARFLLHRDIDYIVRNGAIELVDDFTGRVVPDRQLPDGLQAAVASKEGVARGKEGQILGQITLQHFLARYPRLCGMTATAGSAAEELHEFYGLRTVIIPPHCPPVRVDLPDLVFTHTQAKRERLVDEILRLHATEQPVLVGTASVEESECVAEMLRRRAVDCRVLNAVRDEFEAEIVADAGAAGAVTISTNMAGRGTDIRLGGRDERDRDRVVALGGLFVIGTNRHESRRIDFQLRGRAARQGDPGTTRFFISLEDPLIARYGVQKLIPQAFLPEPSSEPIDHPVIRREIDRAQRIVEGENLEVRRTLTRYAEMMEQQRAPLQDWRSEVLAQPAAVDSDLQDIERLLTLGQIDRGWREHLAYAADLREGIHLLSVMRLDPLAEFQKKIIDAWDDRRVTIDRRIAADAKDSCRNADGLLDPMSTWTYLVNDEPFRNQIYEGLGGTAMGLGIVFNFPIVFAWWLYRRRQLRLERQHSLEAVAVDDKAQVSLEENDDDRHRQTGRLEEDVEHQDLDDDRRQQE